jgi:hypothetical protein
MPFGVQLANSCGDFVHHRRISAEVRDIVVAHVGEVVGDNWQSGDPADVDMERFGLAEGGGLRSVDKHVLARPSLAFEGHPGARVRHQSELFASNRVGRQTQNDVGRRSWSSDFPERKVAADVIPGFLPLWKK